MFIPIYLIILTLFILILSIVGNIILFKKKYTYNKIKGMEEENLNKKENNNDIIKKDTEKEKGEVVLEKNIVDNLTIKLNNAIYVAHTNANYLLSEVGKNVNKIEESTMDIIEKSSKIAHSSMSSIDTLNTKATEIVSIIKNKVNLKNNIANEKEEANVIKEAYVNLINEISSELELIIKTNNNTILSIEGIKKQMKNIYSISKNIINIADDTKVLSINAKIEASRYGNAGSGFNIIAKEMENMSKNVFNYAKLISNNIEDTDNYINKSIEEFKQAIETETYFLKSTIALLKEVFISVINSLIDLKKIIDKLNKVNNNIKKDMEDISFKLQFEDVSRQNFNSIIKSFNLLCDRVSKIKNEGIENLLNNINSEHKDILINRMNIEQEKELEHTTELVKEQLQIYESEHSGEEVEFF